MRRTILPAALAGLLLAAGCGQSYEDKVDACDKVIRAHDFDARPLSEGERLPGCEDLVEEDYNAIIFDSTLADLGWLDDDGNFDKNKMLENTP